MCIQQKEWNGWEKINKNLKTSFYHIPKLTFFKIQFYYIIPLKLKFNIKFSFSIDGTYANKMGNFVNDAQHFSNCEVSIVLVKEIPHLCLFAISNMEIGEELRYDYGEESKKLWWRKHVSISTSLRRRKKVIKIYFKKFMKQLNCLTLIVKILFCER